MATGSKRSRDWRNVAGLIATGLPNVFAVRPPPKNFDASTASAPDLFRYGFPRKQDPKADLSAARAWNRLASRGIKRITAEVRERTTIRHNLPLNIANSGNSVLNDNWSGYVVTPPKADFFTTIFGAWTIPNLTPSRAGESPFWAAIWVGIDGSGSQDVCQGGIDLEMTGFPTQPQVSVWAEWFPALSVVVTNLPAGVGDSMIVVVDVFKPADIAAIVPFIPASQLGIGFSVASVSYINISQRIGTSVIIQNMDFTNENGIQTIQQSAFQGNCAEWIVEAPTDADTNTVLTLGNYGIVQFAEAIAITSQNASVAPDQGAQFIITDPNGAFLSLGEAPPNTVACFSEN